MIAMSICLHIILSVTQDFSWVFIEKVLRARANALNWDGAWVCDEHEEETMGGVKEGVEASEVRVGHGAELAVFLLSHSTSGQCPDRC